MSQRNTPTHVTPPGGPIRVPGIPGIPGIPQLPPPSEDDERIRVSFVLETPDDRGIEPHLEAIGAALGRWHHLLDSPARTPPRVVPRLPGDIRIIDDLRIRPELRPLPLLMPTLPDPRPVPTPGPVPFRAAPGATEALEPMRFTASMKKHVLVQAATLHRQPLLEALRTQPDAAPEPASEPVEFDIEELFDLPAGTDPGLIAQFRQQGLHRFFVLELDTEFNTLKARLGDRAQGQLNEIKYKLQEATRLRSVSLNLPCEGLFGSFSGGNTQPLEDAHAAWHLSSIRATRPAPGVVDPHLPAHLDGRGIRIAHPDTGWTQHPELDAASLELRSQYNVINPLRSAQEPLENPFRQGDVPTLNAHHGTATGSVIISHDTAAVEGVSDVLGVAPGAKLIPIRCASAVVLFTGVSLSRGIMHAILSGADVISMSLGGFGSRYLQLVLKLAITRHIIPVAAAGNGYPLVVCPAIYDETIGVAAVNRHDVRMDTSNASFISASGCGVDVSAPGAGVNRAYWSDQLDPVTGASDGTSYATAVTAGAAALWLQQHGRQQLVSRLRPGETLVDVFRMHLKASARKPLGWDDARMGAGILDVPNLLDPSPLAAHFARAPSPANLALLRPPMSASAVVIKMMCPILTASEVRELLRRALGVGRDMIERMAEEIEQLIRTTREVVEAVGEAIASHLRGVVRRLIDTLRGLLASANEAARRAIRAAIEKLEQGVDLVSAWGDAFARLLDDALEALGASLGAARDAILAALETAKEKLEEAFDQVKSTVRGAVDKVSGALGSLIAV